MLRRSLWEVECYITDTLVHTRSPFPTIPPPDNSYRIFLTTFFMNVSLLTSPYLLLLSVYDVGRAPASQQMTTPLRGTSSLFPPLNHEACMGSVTRSTYVCRFSEKIFFLMSPRSKRRSLMTFLC